MISYTNGDYTFINFTETGADWVRYWPITKTKVAADPIGLAEVRKLASYSIIVNNSVKEQQQMIENQEARGFGVGGIIFIGKEYCYIAYDQGLHEKFNQKAAGYNGFMIFVEPGLTEPPLYTENLTAANLLPTKSYVDGFSRFSGLCPSGVVPLSKDEFISSYDVSGDLDPGISADMVAYYKGKLCAAFHPKKLSCYTMPVPSLASLDTKALISLGKELALELDISDAAEFADDEGFVSLGSDSKSALEALRYYGSYDAQDCKVFLKPKVSDAFNHEALIMAVAEAKTLHPEDVANVRSWLYTEDRLAVELQLATSSSISKLDSVDAANICDLRNGFTDALDFWIKMRGIFLKDILLTTVGKMAEIADKAWSKLKAELYDRIQDRINILYAPLIEKLFDQYDSLSGCKTPSETRRIIFDIPRDVFKFVKPAWMQFDFDDQSSNDYLMSLAQQKGVVFLTSNPDAVSTVRDTSAYDMIFTAPSPAGVTIKKSATTTSLKYSVAGVIARQLEGQLQVCTLYHNWTDYDGSSMRLDGEHASYLFEGDFDHLVVKQITVGASGEELATTLTLKYGADIYELTDFNRIEEIVASMVDSLLVNEDGSPIGLGSSLLAMQDSNLKSNIEESFDYLYDDEVRYLLLKKKDSFRGVHPSRTQLIGLQVVTNSDQSRLAMRYLFKINAYDKQINKWGTARDGMVKVKNLMSSYLHSCLGLTGPVSTLTSISAWGDSSRAVLFACAAAGIVGTAVLTGVAILGSCVPVGTLVAAVGAVILGVASLVAAYFGQYKYSRGPGNVYVAFVDLTAFHTLSTTISPARPRLPACWTDEAILAYSQRMRDQADNMALVYIQPILDSMADCATKMLTLCRFDNGGIVNASTAAQVGTLDVTLIEMLRDAMSVQLQHSTEDVRQKFTDFVGGLSDMIVAEQSTKKLTYYRRTTLEACSATTAEKGFDLNLQFQERI